MSMSFTACNKDDNDNNNGNGNGNGNTIPEGTADVTIQEIANELYFPDQASFSKFVKKMSGVSPNNLRKTNPHQEAI